MARKENKKETTEDIVTDFHQPPFKFLIPSTQVIFDSSCKDQPSYQDHDPENNMGALN